MILSPLPPTKVTVEEIIKQGVKEGNLRDVDAEILAVMLFGAIEAIMREYLIEGEYQPE